MHIWVLLDWCAEDCHEICKGFMIWTELMAVPYHCECECHRRVEAR